VPAGVVKELVAERREQLLDAALVVLSAHGYSGAKVSDIVARAGVAQGTFYLYFRSKREVVLALLDRFCGLLLSERRETGTEIGQADQEWQARMAGRLRRLLRVIYEHRSLARLFFREALGSDPEMEARVRAFHAEMAAVNEALLREAMRRGFVRPLDTRVVGVALNGLWERAIVQFVLLGPEEVDIDRLTEELVALQLNGIRARPNAQQES
jgi:AcrR family transcriptional regulator